MSGKLIIVEGLPGAGKTTITQQLSQLQGYVRVGEILSEDGKEVHFKELQNQTTDFFLGSDLRKYRAANNYLSSENIVLMDRGIVSTLAYVYTQSTLMRNNLYVNVEKWYDLNKSVFIEPSAYVHLIIPPQLCNERKGKKEDSRDLWSFEKNLHITENFYNLFFEKQVVPILRVDAKNVLEEVIACVGKFIECRQIPGV